MTEQLKHCIPQGHGLSQEYINTLHKGDDDNDDDDDDDNNNNNQ